MINNGTKEKQQVVFHLKEDRFISGMLMKRTTFKCK